MSTGLHYLDIGIGIAVFVGIFWWMYVLCSKPGAPGKQPISAKALGRQPWDDDKPGGRGNR